MILFKTSDDLKNFLGHHRQKGSRIGFVPTMGALHAGHISLIKQSKKENDLTVCSIFVNPAQFNVRSDFEKYPSMIDKDLNMLENASCDIVFYPSEKEIYPEKMQQPPHFEIGW